MRSPAAMSATESVVGDGLAAGVLDRRDDFIGRPGLAIELTAGAAAVVVDDHGCALCGEQQGVSAPDAASRARHDRHPSSQSVSHGCPPLIWARNRSLDV